MRPSFSHRAHALALLLSLAAFRSAPAALAAQLSPTTLSIQAGAALGNPDFRGVGLAAGLELGLLDDVSAVGQWTGWTQWNCSTLLDAPSNCRIKGARFAELGLRYRFASDGGVRPFAGAGVGLHSHRAEQSLDDDRGLAISLTAGVDTRVRGPVSVRLSLTHHETVDRDLRDTYGSAVRFTGIQVGLALAL